MSNMILENLIQSFKESGRTHNGARIIKTVEKFRDYMKGDNAEINKLDFDEIINRSTVEFLLQNYPKLTGRNTALEDLHYFWRRLKAKGIIDSNPISDLPEKVEDQEVRCLKILRLIQHEKVGQEELEKHLLVGERQIRDDISVIRNGLSLLGDYSIQVEEVFNKKGKRYFRSSVNPIFLGLNMTQLTEFFQFVQRIAEDNPDKRILSYMTSSIWGQLTDYAKGILKNNGISEEDLSDKYKNRLGFLSEEEWRRELSGAVMYSLKTQTKYEFHIQIDSGREIVRGFVKAPRNHQEDKWSFNVITSEGERSIDYNAVVEFKELAD